MKTKFGIILSLIVCFSFVTIKTFDTNQKAEKTPKSHHDARRLRSKSYSSLYWFLLTTIITAKTYHNYPWISHISGFLALNNAVNMLHYYHESYNSALEEERLFDLVKSYLAYHKRDENILK